MKYYLFAAAVVLFAALVAFGVPALLAMQGMKAIVFIAVVLLIGLGAAAAILVWHYRSKKNHGQEGELAPGGATGELDLLLNEGNRKLRESQQGAKTLDGLPVVYILGESGTAKTTTVLRSGLDPELVAGTVPREGESVPTPVLNLWFTRLAALLEVGTAVRGSNSLLTRLVERTRPKAYRSAFGTGAAARAAIVCVSAEQLQAADGGALLMASARTTGGQLREISRLLGATLPVYVIVTKLDRVPHFEEYVRNLSNVEVRQILGSPLPRSHASAGVYADEASRNLANVLDGLCYKLGEFRVEMLDRETEPRNAARVYEFPREFGKLRKNLNQYLVELCKPSQLSANPYLRGFYFTGIRAQMVERVASPAVEEERPPLNAGATQYLNLSLGKTPSAGRSASQPVMVATRAPQWTFLARLLPEIILGDKSALSATRQTAPARLFRRILYGTLAALFLIYTVLLAVSFVNNHGLESRIQNAARALPKTGDAAISLPSLSDLQTLDRLRQIVLQLDGYNHGESHWSYRFGLYQGEKLEGEAWKVYFDRFRPMMLNPAQAGWLKYLHDLPDAPAQGADYSLYNSAYSPLKAYLITAGNHQYSSTQAFNPVFLSYWMGTRQVDTDSQQLAQTQIDFYATELARQDPYSINADTWTVPHAQSYLHNFGAEPRIYQAMLNDADKSRQSGIDFNKLYPGSAASVIEGHIVRGAFTRDGFAFMQNALQHPEKYVSGERWVLGDQTGQSQGSATISKDLIAQYSSDYLKEWHLFLTDARVVSCGGLHEAAAKLNALAGLGSPLLALFYTVSHNTAVADQTIKSTFQPTQALVDPNAADRFIGPGNTGYVNALLALSGSIDLVAQNPAAGTDPAAFAPIVQNASAAGIAAQQAAQAFNVDPAMHTESTVLALMQAPIQCAAKLPPSPGAAANGGGAKVCGAINPLLGKLPFSPKSTTPASLAEVNQVFAPDTGSVWTTYNGILKQYLVPQVAQYVPAPNPPQPVNPRFVQYFSHVARVTSGLYPVGAKSPTFNFTLHFLQNASSGTTSATFMVDGRGIPAGVTTQNFTWSGTDAQKASLVIDSNEVLPFQGTWSLFQLVREAQITKIGTGYRLDYHLNSNTSTNVNGHAVSQSGSSTKIVSFELSGPGADILAGDAMTGLNCVSTVVK